MTIAELKRSMEGYLAVRDALGFTNRAEKILLPPIREICRGAPRFQPDPC